MGPASTIPAPAPTPRMADMNPMAPATRAAGNSSWMMPKASGKSSPTPWTTRPTRITPRLSPRALISVPTERAMSTPTITFSLPIVSSTRPSTGVAMAALRRYAVSSHDAADSDVCSVYSSCGMAGMMRHCSRLKARAAVASMTKVTP